MSIPEHISQLERQTVQQAARIASLLHDLEAARKDIMILQDVNLDLTVEIAEAREEIKRLKRYVWPASLKR